MGEEKNIIGQLFVNGQPLTVIKEVEFADDFPSSAVIHPEPTEMSFEIEPNECTAAALKEMFQEAEIAYKLMAAAVIATLGYGNAHSIADGTILTRKERIEPARSKLNPTTKTQEATEQK